MAQGGYFQLAQTSGSWSVHGRETDTLPQGGGGRRSLDDNQSQGRKSWPPARAAPPRSSAQLSDSRLLRPSAYQESTGEQADWSQGCRHMAAAGLAGAAGPGVLAHPSHMSADQPWPGEAWGGPGRTPFFRELAICDSIPGSLKWRWG